MTFSQQKATAPCSEAVAFAITLEPKPKLMVHVLQNIIKT